MIRYFQKIIKKIIKNKKKVFAASNIAACYIKEKLPLVKKCYVVGMSGICEEL